MPAPRGAVAGGADGDLQLGRPRVDDLDGELGECDRLRPNRLDARLGDELDARPHRDHRDDRRGAADDAPDPCRRLVAVLHLECIDAPEPAPDRLGDLLLQISSDVAECRSAWPAVQVLVRAADREVDVAFIEVDGHGAHRMAEIPQDERAGVVHDPGDRSHVGEVA